MYSSKILLINDDTYKWLINTYKRLINDDTIKTEYQTLAYTEHIHQRSCRGVVHNMIGLIGLFLISLMERADSIGIFSENLINAGKTRI